MTQYRKPKGTLKIIDIHPNKRITVTVKKHPQQRKISLVDMPCIPGLLYKIRKLIKQRNLEIAHAQEY